MYNFNILQWHFFCIASFQDSRSVESQGEVYYDCVSYFEEEEDELGEKEEEYLFQLLGDSESSVRSVLGDLLLFVAKGYVGPLAFPPTVDNEYVSSLCGAESETENLFFGEKSVLESASNTTFENSKPERGGVNREEEFIESIVREKVAFLINQTVEDYNFCKELVDQLLGLVDEGEKSQDREREILSEQDPTPPSSSSSNLWNSFSYISRNSDEVGSNNQFEQSDQDIFIVSDLEEEFEDEQEFGGISLKQILNVSSSSCSLTKLVDHNLRSEDVNSNVVTVNGCPVECLTKKRVQEVREKSVTTTTKSLSVKDTTTAATKATITATKASVSEAATPVTDVTITTPAATNTTTTTNTAATTTTDTDTASDARKEVSTMSLPRELMLIIDDIAEQNRHLLEWEVFGNSSEDMRVVLTWRRLDKVRISGLD